ncbi:MAG: diguanylate cyclase [Planctomycetota bacterium]
MEQIRVLLAEDNYDHRRLLLLALRAGGPQFGLTTARNGTELIDAARNEKFDCFVLDYSIPPDTASDLVPKLNEIQPDVPIIVVSSSEAQLVVIESLRKGVADFIPKNDAIQTPALAERVQQAVSNAKRRAREQRRIHRRMQNLEAHANTDALTGLLNRRGLERIMTGRLLSGDRRGTLAIYLFDLDHFKRINDTFGHHEGDRVLQAFGRILAQEAGTNTIAGRWGGEEFVAFNHEADLASAWAWAERVRRRVETEVHLPLGDQSQTVSIGVDLIPTAEFTTRIIERADGALYFAKDSGRNRVCTYDMVAIHAHALDIASTPRMTPRTKLLTLIKRLRSTLGPTQLEQVGTHGARVRALSNAVGTAISLSEEEQASLDLAAEFHDIGKLAIPDSILRLERRLTKDERLLVLQHPWFGAQIVAACGGSELATAAIECHQNRFDQSVPVWRCPYRLARIIGACDAYAAMTSKRAYAPPLAPQEALTELTDGRGRQFDHDVIDVLRSVDRSTRRAA